MRSPVPNPAIERHTRMLGGRTNQRQQFLNNVPQVDVALHQLRRFAADAQKPLQLALHQLQLPLGHKQYWPVYQEADRLGCALSIHSCNSLRDNDRYLQPNEAATLTHVMPQMRQFTNIMFSGVLNKLKKLRVGFLEAGCGWVPFLMSKIEERLERVDPKERPVLPSELLARKQLFFQCGEEVTTKRDVELLGDNCLLWASDFPHEATRTDMRQLVKEHFARKDLSRKAKKKIIYDNAKRFYAL